MSLVNCTRCGVEIAAEQMLCGKCSDWLGEQPPLDEPALLEALQFDAKPLPGVTPIMTTMAFSALPLVLESLIAGYWFLSVQLDPVVGAPFPPSHSVALLLLMMSSLLSLGAIALGTYMARSRPFRALLVSGSLFVGLTAVTGFAALAMRITDHLFELRAVLLLRGIAMVMFALPTALSLLRQRKLKQGRARLQAARNTAAE